MTEDEMTIEALRERMKQLEAVIVGKDAVINEKDAVIADKEAVIQAQHAAILRLQKRAQSLEIDSDVYCEGM